MLMQLRDLYNIAKDTTEEVITDAQNDSVFNYVNIIFFSIVKPTYVAIIGTKTIDEIEIELTSLVGQIDIIENLASFAKEIPVVYIKHAPKDYNDFNLLDVYQSDYLMVCEYLILNTSMKNINMIKSSFGVEEIAQQTQLNINELRDSLAKKYQIEETSSITM